MGTLLNLLQAAAGEGALRSRLGQWRQAVSRALDSVEAAVTIINNSAAGGDSALPILDILQTKRSGTDQVGVGTGDDVVLNNTIFSTGQIAYDFNTGVYTLAPGKIYELSAWGELYNFSDTTSGELVIEWVDANTDLPISTSVPGIFHPASYVAPVGDSPQVNAVFNPGSAIEAQIKLLVTDASGTADISQSFGAIVKQLR